MLISFILVLFFVNTRIYQQNVNVAMTVVRPLDGLRITIDPCRWYDGLGRLDV